MTAITPTQPDRRPSSPSHPEFRPGWAEPRAPTKKPLEAPRTKPHVRLVPGVKVRTSARLEALDAARLWATWAVIFVHTAEMHGQSAALAALGRFGTSFYVAALALLTIHSFSRTEPRSFLQDLKLRARRLLGPFLLWSLVYGLFYGFHAFRKGHTFADLVTWWGPFAGTARHLWFLPFAFAAGLGVQACLRHLPKLSARRLLVGGLLVSTVSYLFFRGLIFFTLSRSFLHQYHLHRFDRWMEEIPLIVLTSTLVLYFTRLFKERPPSTQQKRRLGTVAFTLFGLSQALYFFLLRDLDQHTGSEHRYLAHLAGLSLLGGFLAWGSSPWMRGMRRYAKWTYFGFLAHILVLDVIHPWLVNLPFMGSLWFAVLTTWGVFFTCSWLAERLHQSGHLHWFTGSTPRK